MRLHSPRKRRKSHRRELNDLVRFSPFLFLPVPAAAAAGLEPSTLATKLLPQVYLMYLPCFDQGTLTTLGRPSTVDLLIKVACFVFDIKSSWSKLVSARWSTVSKWTLSLVCKGKTAIKGRLSTNELLFRVSWPFLHRHVSERHRSYHYWCSW